MGNQIPTTKELFDSVLAYFEAGIGQTAPSVPKAVLRQFAKAISGVGTILYKASNRQLKQVLAQTAKLEGLKIIGAEQNPIITYKLATRAELTLSVTTSVAGETIPINYAFVADDTNIRYFPIAAVTTVVGTTSVPVRCETAGTDGNLNVSDTLTLDRSVTGATSSCTVASVDYEAIDDEDLEVFRSRVLTAKRATPGYGNAYDYKNWSESVTGVKTAFPYSGKPGGDESVTAFADGNAETAGVADWTAENSATVTKNAVTFHGGTQSLQVARNGVNDPMASQACLVVGQYYTFHAWFYSDGNAIPVICDDDSKTTVYHRAPAVSGWRYVDITFKAITTDLMLCAETSSGTEYVLWDDMELFVSFPGDRSIYIECEESINPDGIAPQSLLDAVRVAVLVDPISSLSRMGLVDTDDRLYVESITRTEIHVRLSNLAVSPSRESEVKASVKTAIEEYLKAIKCYIIGYDSELDRNDTITLTTLSATIQYVLSSQGATVTDIEFDLDGTYTAPLAWYKAEYGELFKLTSGGLDWV